VEELLEDCFALNYCMKGVTYTCVSEHMDGRTRNYYLKRLNKQLKMEHDEAEAIKGGKSKRPRKLPKK
jgi:hypothetical protein